MTATADYIIDNGVLITDRQTLTDWLDSLWREERDYLDRNGDRNVEVNPIVTLDVDSLPHLDYADLEAVGQQYLATICANLDVEADTIRLCGEVES